MLQFGLVIFWQNNTGAKAVRKKMFCWTSFMHPTTNNNSLEVESNFDIDD